MPRIQYLLEQIERAKRYAAALSDPADRERFEKVAADYQSELDAAAGTSDQQSPSVPTVTASSHATAATSEAGSSDAVSSESDSAPTSTDFQQETRISRLDCHPGADPSRTERPVCAPKFPFSCFVPIQGRVLACFDH